MLEVRHLNRQGCQRGEEHPREGRSEVHSRRPARGTKGSDEGERDDDSNPPSRWREGNTGLIASKCCQNHNLTLSSRVIRRRPSRRASESAILLRTESGGGSDWQGRESVQRRRSASLLAF